MTLASRTLRCLAAAILLAAPHAPSQTLDDPANLAGERVSPPALADTLPINHGAPALQQLLLKLRTRASLMMIVAHPDDEDGGLLTYESRGQGARVAMLTLTRGEGGQNLMSADFDDALGLIRTQELLAADRYMGVDQMFGTEVDFGFSKTREETLSKWTHDRVLYDAVRCVRLYRPLVLASVFVGGVTDGHGHHQVAGEIAQEVFLAAADPKVFPEMGLPPWAPLKVYARVPFFPVTAQGMFDYATGKYAPPLFHNYVTGKDITHEPTPTVLIHEGERSTIDGKPALGMEELSYVQFARKGLAVQKTQIGANVRLAPPGAYDVGYTLMASRICSNTTTNSGSTIDPTIGCPILSASGKGRVSGASPTALDSTPEQSLFDGIDTSLLGIASLAPAAKGDFELVLKTNLQGIDLNVAEAQTRFDPSHLELTADPLRTSLIVLDTLINEIREPAKWNLPIDQKVNLLHELRIKRVQLNDALLLALSATLTATSDAFDAESEGSFLRGTSHKVVLTPNGPGSAHVESLAILGPAGALKQLLSASYIKDSSQLHETTAFAIPVDAPLTVPYFSRSEIEQSFYDLSDQNLRNAPQAPAPLSVAARLNYEGVTLEQQVVLDTRQISHPAVIVPRLSIEIQPGVEIVSTRTPRKPFDFDVSVRTNVANLSPRLELDSPPTWQILSPANDDTLKHYTLKHVNDVHTVHLSMLPDTSNVERNARGQPIEAFALEPERAATVETNLGYRTVGYPGLTPTNFYQPARLRVIPVDVTTAPNLKVAYLPGTGDNVPAFLSSLGVRPTLLTLADLTADRLKQFDTVVLGVRAYNAQPKLAGSPSAALLDYARNGGIVIAQYNTGNFPPNSLPYPLEIPGDPGHNVVVEADPVEILAPQSPLLNWPNRITAHDFDNWVEERGHGFAASFDPHYQALVETHDPEQDPQRGGLLLAPVGRGAYIYCALALYRQLPEGVPGAYRLFANLLSLGRNPALTAKP